MLGALKTASLVSEDVARESEKMRSRFANVLAGVSRKSTCQDKGSRTGCERALRHKWLFKCS